MKKKTERISCGNIWLWQFMEAIWKIGGTKWSPANIFSSEHVHSRSVLFRLHNIIKFIARNPNTET